MAASASVPSFVQLAAHPVRWQLLTTLSGGDHRVRELATLAGEPQNLVSYHLRVLRDGGLVTTTRSSFDGRDSYYHLDLDRCGRMLADVGAVLHPALAPTRKQPPSGAAGPVAVLFVCTGNSSRSPIAEALLRRHSDLTCSRGVEIFSGGTDPKPEMHPLAVRVLREDFGIDISGRAPRHLAAVTGRRFDAVVTLCDKARENCPEFDGDTRCIHWSIPDPAATADSDAYPTFRAVAADIDNRVRHLLPALARIPRSGPSAARASEGRNRSVPTEKRSVR
ncbi:arsenate reductase/protein-tyrosine-phosphatase family protein [Rhodococcus coprophilus]|uniref:ArsR family transcriptional regulator n=1 Tax=Rhodococcus coprophilus TaxID=38310 RepID=A0A2X4UJG7_9NOCA|nr:helix-turn-helix domain-containing protein [Rhodococcus coprophilus]MBM7460238.1 protein-tyrosine-phosphatase/DNA-binding transcriptional ArsR family regulator [Rhodococcus coprophilus]SQI38801.1 ArsR family transcriptional regulator [Rhodococcus coprophilus]